MSTQVIGTAAEFAGERTATKTKTKTGHGGHGFMGLLATLFHAIGTARAAEADYRNLVARGASPADAAHTAFSRN